MNSHVFFLPNVMGGVASVINNVIKFGDFPNGSISVIAYGRRSSGETKTLFFLPEGVTLNYFDYNENDNLYHIVNHLRKCMSESDPKVLIATDSLELQMVQLLKIDCKVIFIVLGDFNHYYQIAVKHQNVINQFIVISKEINTKLANILPNRCADISLAYFPTPSVSQKKFSNDSNVLRIIFVGRLVTSKQPLILIEIDKLLKIRRINVEWTVVGSGELEEALRRDICFSNAKNFVLTGSLSNEDLHKLYIYQDLFILPSLTEGLPVSLVEAMKVGLIPVVSNIDGGIREIVEHGVTGFLCEPQNSNNFADCIEYLANNMEERVEIEQNAIAAVQQQFDSYNNGRQYFKIIEETNFISGMKQFGVKLDRLDRKCIPTFFTRNLRQFKFLFQK